MKMPQRIRARRHYRSRGYEVFRGAFAANQIDAIANLARTVAGSSAKLRRQDGTFAVNDFFPGTTLVRNPLLHAHLSLPADLEQLSTDLRALVTCDALAERLQALDGQRHYVVHQSLLFFAAQTTDIHLDSWSLDTAPRGHSHTVWIPLQDMDHRTGLPCVIPWRSGDVVTEHQLGLMPGGADPRAERYELYHRALRQKLLADHPEVVTALVGRGDFMIWSSLTPHFTLPAHPFPTERLSLQVLIRPADKRWGDFLDQPYNRTSVQLERINNRFSIKLAA